MTIYLAFHPDDSSAEFPHNVVLFSVGGLGGGEPGIDLVRRHSADLKQIATDQLHSVLLLATGLAVQSTNQ